MSATASISTHAARLPMMLTELRLPSIKRLWSSLAAQSDREGWPAEKLLAVLLEHEIAEREQRRLVRHRLESNLSADKTLANFDFRSGAKRIQGADQRPGRRRCLDRAGRQLAAVWPTRKWQDAFDQRVGARLNRSRL